MNINLRFGMHRDIPLIHAEKAKIDGLVIPAHILAYQSAPTSVFVASMPEHNYIIDPMTFILQHEKSDNLNEAGELRRSVCRMCEAYHQNLVGILEGLNIDQRLGPHNFPPVPQLCNGILSFQRDVIATESTTSKAAKYISRYGRQTPTAPRFLVAPYFKFVAIGDDWYQFSLQCARESQRICANDSLGAVIYCSTQALSPESINTIAEDYRQFHHLQIWLDDFNEIAISEPNILSARRLINALASNDAEVETLYGGNLMLLMQQEGLRAISHGILYTQHKGFSIVPGGGGAPERYYIPRFRGFRSLSQTDLIFHQHPELICTCEVCAEVMGNNPDRIILFRDEPDLLRTHFVTVRREEADRANDLDRTEEVAALRETYETYDGSIRRLPNPDAFRSGSRMVGLEYLAVWARGLEQAM